MTRKVFRYIDGKVRQVSGPGAPRSAGSNNVHIQRDFHAFSGKQIDPKDPAIDEVGLKRTSEGEPIFETRQQAYEFTAASQDSPSSDSWQYDGMDTKPRVPDRPNRIHISTRKRR